jgi:hypothetical protein
VIEPFGQLGDRVLRVDHDVLREATLAEGRPHDDAEHLIAHRQPGHVRPERGHLSGEVLAQDNGKLVLVHALEVAAEDAEVEPVDRRGPQPNQHLTRPRFRHRQIGRRELGAEGGKGHCVHS